MSQGYRDIEEWQALTPAQVVEALDCIRELARALDQADEQSTAVALFRGSRALLAIHAARVLPVEVDA